MVIKVTINKIHDFNKLKKAKRIVKDLETVMKILNLTHIGLKPFRDYTSLQETLLCIEDSKTILQIHLDHQKNVLKNKGEVIEE